MRYAQIEWEFASGSSRNRSSKGSLKSRKAGNRATGSGSQASTANGFSVLRIGRFGISVEGTVEDFHRAFGVTVESGKALVSTVAPAAPGLSAIDLVEVASSPTTFATTNE